MNWDKVLVLGGQIAVLVVLGTLVLCGNNDAVTSGLMAVSGSIAGVGLYQTVRKP